MSDFNVVDPKGWECDLHSVYSAYMGYFQLHSVPWYERSWGVFFESFDEFLSFAWPVITVTDRWTGRAHIVTRPTSIGAFIKMVKTRFGETLPMVDNILRVTPFETSQRHLRTVSDIGTYKKLQATLPAAYLATLKLRVRSGEPRAVHELWSARDKTFLSINFEWSERNPSSCLELGYAAVRCGHLEGIGTWPPDPDPNYRRGHYIVGEYADKVHNKYRPNFPWAYVFGESQVVPKAKLTPVISAIISSLSSPDSETVSNTLVLVGHGISGDLKRMREMGIKFPHNILVIDTADYERQLFKTGQRGVMLDPSGNTREPGHTLSLVNLLQSLGVDLQCIMHNAGNEAFMGLLAFQLLLDPESTKIPSQKGSAGRPGMARNPSRSPTGIPSIAFMPTPPIASPLVMMPTGSPNGISPRTPDGYFDQDMAAARRLPGHSPIRSEPRERRASLLPPGRSGSRPRVSSGASINDLAAHVADMKFKHSVLDA